MKSFSKLSVPLGLLAGLLAFYVPVGRSFSDTIYLIGRVEAGAPPYYNVAYVPLGRLFKSILGAWLGAEGALLLLSAASVGAGVAVSVKLALELGASRFGALIAGLLLAFAPAVLFFGGVVEVHAVQFLGASWAVSLAWRARSSSFRVAWLLLGASGLIAMLAHLSNLLLLPGLVAFAWRPNSGEPLGCHFTRRSMPVVGLLSVIVAACGAALASSDFATWSVEPAWQWLGALILFGKTFLGGFLLRGLFSAGEVFGYLGDELIAPFGLLCLGVPGAVLLGFGPLASSKRSFSRRALLAFLPALLILPQGGVYERGGYFMSLAPILTVLVGLVFTAEEPSLALKAQKGRTQTAYGAALDSLRLWRTFGVVVFCLAMVGVQLALALNARQDFRAAAPEARIWARAVSELMSPGDSALVGSLSRHFALADSIPGTHVRDLSRDLALVPEAARIAMLERVLTERFGDARFPGDLWIDASLLPGLNTKNLSNGWSSIDFSEPWQARMFELLTSTPSAQVSLECLDLGDPDQAGLWGFDMERTPALIRVRRRGDA